MTAGFLLLSTAAAQATPDAGWSLVPDSCGTQCVHRPVTAGAPASWTEEAEAVHPAEGGPSGRRVPYLTHPAPGVYGSTDSCRRAGWAERYGREVFRTTHRRDPDGTCVEAPWIFDRALVKPSDRDVGVVEACQLTFGTGCWMQALADLDLSAIATVADLCTALGESPEAGDRDVVCNIGPHGSGSTLTTYWVGRTPEAEAARLAPRSSPLSRAIEQQVEAHGAGDPRDLATSIAELVERHDAEADEAIRENRATTTQPTELPADP